MRLGCFRHKPRELADIEKRAEGTRCEERVARPPEDARVLGLVVDKPPYERRLADTRFAADEDEAPGLRAGGAKLREEFLALEEFGHAWILRRQAVQFKRPARVLPRERRPRGLHRADPDPAPEGDRWAPGAALERDPNSQPIAAGRQGDTRSDPPLQGLNGEPAPQVPVYEDLDPSDARALEAQARNPSADAPSRRLTDEEGRPSRVTGVRRLRPRRHQRRRWCRRLWRGRRWCWRLWRGRLWFGRGRRHVVAEVAAPRRGRGRRVDRPPRTVEHAARCGAGAAGSAGIRV